MDDDCDGVVDEDDAVDALTWYADADGDGFGDPTSAITACDEPSGFVADASDCDDGAATVFPGADEYCNGVDDDCDEVVDEDDALDASTWYGDGDGDGFGDAASTTTACDEPSGFVADASDCDDGAASVFPGADEYCNGVDDDCDDSVDEDDALDATTWYADADGDGFGDPDTATTACDEPSGFTTDASDCDDTDASVYPGADGWTEDCQPIEEGDDTGLIDDKPPQECGCSSGDPVPASGLVLLALAPLAMMRRRERRGPRLPPACQQSRDAGSDLREEP